MPNLQPCEPFEIGFQYPEETKKNNIGPPQPIGALGSQQKNYSQRLANEVKVVTQMIIAQQKSLFYGKGEQEATS